MRRYRILDQMLLKMKMIVTMKVREIYNFSFSLCFDSILQLDLEFEHQDDVDVDLSNQMDTDSPENSNTTFLTTLVAPLLTLIQPTALSFPPLASPSPHPPTTSALSALHICALECLNNVFLSLTTSRNLSIPLDASSGRTVWDGVWSALSLIGTQTGLGQERRQEAWNIAVGVLWGVGRIWKGSIVSFFLFLLYNSYSYFLSSVVVRHQTVIKSMC